MAPKQILRTEPRVLSSGVLLVDKPKGMTSHDVVARVRRVFGQREVGHTGTLDPMATGLLVLALGRATRLARFIEAADKCYVGSVTLGRATTTYDAEGETTEESPVGPLDPSTIERALAGLRGEICQSVPAYSAVKVDGERLYARARRGEVVEGPSRRVFVHALSALAIQGGLIEIEAVVSKGTYIRSLAVQIGAALGLPAHLSALRRTRVGCHPIANAFSLDSLRGDVGELLPMNLAVRHLPSVRLDGAGVEDVRHGRPLSAERLRGRVETRWNPGTELQLLDPGGSLIGIGVSALDSADLETGPSTQRAVSYACVLAP